MQQEKTVGEVKKALGEPVWCGLSESAVKARRGLLTVGLIDIAIYWVGLRIDSQVTIFGAKISGWNESLLLPVLFLITLYFFCHFCWLCWDSVLEWRIRITGTRVAFITTARLANSYSDYPNDPQQSSLYHWWSEEAKRIGNFTPVLQGVVARLNELEKEVHEKEREGASSLDIRSACTDIGRTVGDIAKVVRSIEGLEKTLESNRIPASLQRFDSWFKLFLKSQNLRWLVFDMLIPLTVGFGALALLVLPNVI